MKTKLHTAFGDHTPTYTNTFDILSDIHPADAPDFSRRWYGWGLKLNPEKPLCYKCFKSWEKYNNPEYTEKFCHACGTKYSSTVAKPVCYACYKKLGK